MRTEFEVPTRSRIEFVDITAEVQRAVRDQAIEEGVCHVFVPHTTAAVTINENADPDVARDVIAVLSRLVPQGGDYRHREGNADAHAKATIVGPSVTVPISGGRLVLGTWQAVYFCEFDGPRRRRCIVTAIPTHT